MKGEITAMEYREENQLNSSEQLARRRLLKTAVYVPPAILGSMMVSPSIAEAVVVTLPGGGTYTVSALTSTCVPCTKTMNGTGTPADALNCLKDQCKNNCINCDAFVANAAEWGKTTCSKCEKVTKNNCPTLPAACLTALNQNGDACCTQATPGGPWTCKK